MHEKFGSQESQYDYSRISLGMDRKEFFAELDKLQVPCPWGDLSKGEGLTQMPEGLEDLAEISEVPLALIVGASVVQLGAYRSIAMAKKFDKIVKSDVGTSRDDNYVKIDLTKPEEINLFGYKVHAIMSSAVFTYDGRGVEFKSERNELDAAKALDNLLMPGGIFASDSLDSSRFEDLLIKSFGYKLIRSKPSKILQKPQSNSEQKKDIDVIGKLRKFADEASLSEAEENYLIELGQEFLDISKGRTFNDIEATGDIELARDYLAKLREIKSFQDKLEVEPEIELPRLSKKFGISYVYVGGIMYRANDRGDNYVDEDGELICEEGFLDYSTRAMRVADKFYIVGKTKNNNDVVINAQGQVVGEEYRYVGPMVEVGDRMVFKAEEKGTGQMFIVDGNGDEYGYVDINGHKETYKFKTINNMIVVGDEVVFSAINNNDESVVFYKGKEIKGDFNGIDTLINMGNGFVFRTKKSDGSYCLIDESGNEVATNSKLIDNVYDLNGSPSYTILEENFPGGKETYVIVLPGGKKIRGNFSNVRDILPYVGDKINGVAFVFKDDEGYAVYPKMKKDKFSKYKRLFGLQNIGGKLYVKGEKDSGEFVMMDDEANVICESTLFVPIIYEVNGKVLIGISKNSGYMMLVDVNGKRCSKNYKEIKEVIEEDGKVYVIGDTGGMVVKQRIFV